MKASACEKDNLMKQMRNRRRIGMLILFVTLILAMSTTAFAAKAGWVKSGKKISYNVKIDL